MNSNLYRFKLGGKNARLRRLSGTLDLKREQRLKHNRRDMEERGGASSGSANVREFGTRVGSKLPVVPQPHADWLIFKRRFPTRNVSRYIFSNVRWRHASSNKLSP